MVMEVMKIIRELKAAIEKDDRGQIVAMVCLTLRITVILGDDGYLERALDALCKDVFGIPADPSLFRCLEELKNTPCGSCTVSGLKLKKSTLTPQGPVYEDLAEVTW